MLHHVSFTAIDPANVARTLGSMLGAQTVAAPTPPFPEGSWFVCFGDTKGSYLEVLPAGSAFDPDARGSLRHDPTASRLSGGHVLVNTPLSAAALQAAAATAGWRTEIADTRLFQVVKVWVEGDTLIEFLPPEMQAAYVATFGSQGLPSLDAKLRKLEGR